MIGRLMGLLLARYPRCYFCGTEKNLVNGHCCDKCARSLGEAPGSSVAGFKSVALYAYSAPASTLVQDFKYNGKLYLAHDIAALLCERYISAGLAADVVTNVPLHPRRRRERGFDQAEKIARHFAKLSGLSYVKTLERLVNTPTQTRLSVSERHLNVKGAFGCVVKLDGERVILIDDVLTTGATMTECGRALKAAGAGEVTLMAFARALKSGDIPGDG